MSPLPPFPGLNSFKELVGYTLKNLGFEVPIYAPGTVEAPPILFLLSPSLKKLKNGFGLSAEVVFF
jgi:hypothetical protein